MDSKNIGIVIDKQTKNVVSIINPDYDEQLDDPAFVTSDRELRMIKIAREKCGSFKNQMSIADLAEAMPFIEEYIGNYE